MTAYFPLLYARLCPEELCSVLYDMRHSRICPRCGSALGLPISRYLNKPAQPTERKEKRA